jgi:DNA polymerase-4
MRKLWGNVTGERLWYALHGYDLQTPPSGRGMYGHGRVLPPSTRTLEHARAAARLLLTKAARRMRRDGWNAGRLALWLGTAPGSARIGCLESTTPRDLVERSPGAAAAPYARHAPRGYPLRSDPRQSERQLDMLLDDDPVRRQWERITEAIDALNRKHGRTLVSIGPWTPPPGGYAGGKISYTRIPSAEDFW